MREMEVWITADSLEKKRGYSGARLTLPAGQETIRDAMQRAHVQENESYQVEYTSGWPEFLVRILEGQTKCRLDEINLLAYQLSRMAQEQMDTMEGAIALRIEEDVGSPVTMKEVINFTYNLDCYDFHPGVIDDEDLGEICIDGGMLELFKKLPDDVVELLDPQKVGAELRRSDQGTYTSKGYVFRCEGNFQEIYDGSQCPEIPDIRTGIISVRLVSLAHQDEQGVWLDLPADEQTMKQALTTLKERSFDYCLIAENKGSAMPFSLIGDEEIGKLNLLAERVQAFPDSRTLAKYKAAMELERCDDLDLALDIVANLDSYNFDQKIFSPARYAEYLLDEAGFDTEDPAFKWFDFEGFGERKLKEISYIPTAYGLISRNEIPFRQEYSRPQQGMKLQ